MLHQKKDCKYRRLAAQAKRRRVMTTARTGVFVPHDELQQLAARVHLQRVSRAVHGNSTCEASVWKVIILLRYSAVQWIVILVYVNVR